MILRGAAILLLLCVSSPSLADQLVFSRKSQWETWDVPLGAIDLRSDGSLTTTRFGDEIDPLLNMGDFSHPTRTGGDVNGGISAQTSQAAARFVLDRDESTWWKPSANASIDDWTLTIDLGRLVLLKQIRLVFADTVGARPFEHFSVFVSEGMPIWDGRDAISYKQVAATILPNRESEFTIDLFTIDPRDGPNAAIGENLVTADSLRFMPVQYIRFVPRDFTEDAALAEIEALALGENILLGTFGRGGSIRSSQKFERTAPNLFDGSVEQFWGANAVRSAEAEWRIGGQYFELDLGVSFWLNQIVLYAWPPTLLGQTSFQFGSGPWGHELEVSDGTPIDVGSGGERLRGPYDYERITLVDNGGSPKRWIFQHPFERRKVRYVFYHHFLWGRGHGWGFKMWEAFMYAPGHPAEVELTSPMTNLRGIKRFETVSWEADVPPGTAIEIRTKSGDEITKKSLYYNRANKLLTGGQAAWDKLLPHLRGPVEEIEAEGADWSSWSEPYKISGEPFKSPSPRAFVRFKVMLKSEDPEVAPILKSLAVEFGRPLFQRAVEAEVLPRESSVGVWGDFRLRILRPQFRSGDLGYDGVVIPIAGEVRDVSVSIAGSVVENMTSEFSDDTLRVDLSQRVLRDSVEVRFSARLLQSPTVLSAVLTNSNQPGIDQEVNPSEREGNDALIVFLPDLAGTGNLIANVSVGGGAVTPNRDNINEDLRVSFDLLKVDAIPQVKFYDLQGRLVAVLAGRAGQRQAYTWDATDSNGELVPPGIYLCLIEVETDGGTRSVTEVVSVIY